jgi:hypothetical protein
MHTLYLVFLAIPLQKPGLPHRWLLYPVTLSNTENKGQRSFKQEVNENTPSVLTIQPVKNMNVFNVNKDVYLFRVQNDKSVSAAVDSSNECGV